MIACGSAAPQPVSSPFPARLHVVHPTPPADALSSGRSPLAGVAVRIGFWALVVLVVVLVGAPPAPLGAQEPFRSRCGAAVHVDDAGGLALLPQGGLFCPLVADPKSEHSFLSYLRGDFATIADPELGPETDIGAIGIADSFGLLRIGSEPAGNGLQLDLMGAIFAQFNLDAPSFDLINADYIVGLPVTMRLNGLSGRLRLYHQSSHLGDEFLLSREPERENLSFESLELIVSQEVGALRVYAGGESFFRRRPLEVVSRLAHGGVELRPASLGAGRLVAALDVKAVKSVDWELGWSARAGVEIAHITNPGHPPRVLSLLGHWYEGPAPYGQFYRDNIGFLGFGLHFSP